jgi:hypothetical protein
MRILAAFGEQVCSTNGMALAQRRGWCGQCSGAEKLEARIMLENGDKTPPPAAYGLGGFQRLSQARLSNIL